MNQPSAAGSTRHQARVFALQVLYARDLEHDTDVEAAVAQWPMEFALEMDAGAAAFARELLSAAVGRASEVDATLAGASKNWRIERMARVDRNILRLGTAELTAVTSTPVKVVINEAVELAKQFGTAESAAFVNGVLDRVAASLGRDPAA